MMISRATRLDSHQYLIDLLMNRWELWKLSYGTSCLSFKVIKSKAWVLKIYQLKRHKSNSKVKYNVFKCHTA